MTPPESWRCTIQELPRAEASLAQSATPASTWADGVAGMALELDPIAAAIAFLAVLLAFTQWMIALRRERTDNTFRMMEMLLQPAAQLARHRVRAIMKNAESKNFDFDQIPEEERATIASIGILFGVIGLAYRKNRIDRTLFMSVWGNTVRENFKRLRPYKQWRDGRLGQRQSPWREFELFAASAEKRNN